MTTPWLPARELRGHGVVLEPLDEAHDEALRDAACELEPLWYTLVPTAESIDAYLADARRMEADGSARVFVVRRAANGHVVGSTRFCNVDAANRRLEIGYTWLVPAVRRTAVNSACKLLLLEHAFEVGGAIAVEFRTHGHNRRSRAAIERLGAKQDGVLRQHRRDADGAFRDTVVYSILDSEWPTVRKGLQAALAGRG
ncbi:MAG: GNAT family N-acetyltransferase [Planctomycetes bacterium]|nr:GNAT family N-acetyltransferase [Planctomycetota bacterium]